LAWGTLMLFFFTLGIPALYFFMMKRKTDLASHRRVYGYLFSGFVERAWYWEVWNAVRKALITACSTLFQAWGVPMQTWSSLGLMMFFLALFVHVQPYHNPVLNRLELYALTADLLTLFLGLGLFNNKNAGEMRSEGFAQIFSILVVVVNVWFIGYMLYVVWKNSEYLKKAKSIWRKEDQTWVKNEFNNPMYKAPRKSTIHSTMASRSGVEMKKVLKALKKRSREVELQNMRQSMSV
jgi:hypothetical protein